ncbi:MAG: hypothetical protein II926_10460 [Bacteroidales bacterium]|nr:hypothetical protein [Bacteroidales bacterium]
MKKLKFLALGLVAAFGFAACGDEGGDQTSKSGNEYQESTISMGGAQSKLGSAYTFDKGVQTMTELGDNAQNVVFLFQTIDANKETLENFRFVSGTEAVNEIIKRDASKTVFVMIGDGDANKFEKVNWSEGTTTIDVSRKIENGKKAVAFKNDKCEGFFELINFDQATENLSMKIWVLKAAE